MRKATLVEVNNLNKGAQAAGKRFVGFAKLVRQVKATVEESGDPGNFNAGVWIARWVAESLPALNGCGGLT